MHQIVLLTAMTATTGLFGGRHHAPRYYGQAYAPATCSAQGQCPAPRYAPAPVAPAPQPVSYYHSNYYAPAAATCPNGNCARR